MKLTIVSPERTLFSGEVQLVTLPGTLGSFTVLENHAPIISSLSEGNLTYRTSEGDNEIQISGGFIEVNKDVVSVCIEESATSEK